MSEQDRIAPEGDIVQEHALRSWVRPELHKMSAGSAEAGPNPISPEGPFAFGS